MGKQFVGLTKESFQKLDDFLSSGGGGGGGTIPDGAVTTAKLADGAVTTGKLADNAVTLGKLSQDVQEAIAEGVSGSKLAATAEALLGADETAQWATRKSTGTGSATVRSVQGAAEVIDGALVPVQIAGIRSTTAQGGELDSVEWAAQTLRAAGSVADMLYSDHVDVNVGVVDLGTFNWARYEVTAGSGIYAFESTAFAVPFAAGVTNFKTALYPCVGNSRNLLAYTDKAMAPWNSSTTQYFGIRDDAYNGDAAAFKAAMSGVYLFYELATPTTQPINPALPMTYKVQQGGSESIIVPDGEVSAAPVLTVAEGESAAELVMDALAAIAAPDGPVATSNHAINTYLTMGGKLYKVTTAIATGETIAAGTNVTETTVMAELIALTQ